MKVKHDHMPYITTYNQMTDQNRLCNIGFFASILSCEKPSRDTSQQLPPRGITDTERKDAEQKRRHMDNLIQKEATRFRNEKQQCQDEVVKLLTTSVNLEQMAKTLVNKGNVKNTTQIWAGISSVACRHYLHKNDDQHAAIHRRVNDYWRAYGFQIHDGFIDSGLDDRYDGYKLYLKKIDK